MEVVLVVEALERLEPGGGLRRRARRDDVRDDPLHRQRAAVGVARRGVHLADANDGAVGRREDEVTAAVAGLTLQVAHGVRAVDLHRVDAALRAGRRRVPLAGEHLLAVAREEVEVELAVLALEDLEAARRRRELRLGVHRAVVLTVDDRVRGAAGGEGHGEHQQRGAKCVHGRELSCAARMQTQIALVVPRHDAM